MINAMTTNSVYCIRQRPIDAVQYKDLYYFVRNFFALYVHVSARLKQGEVSEFNLKGPLSGWKAFKCQK